MGLSLVWAVPYAWGEGGGGFWCEFGMRAMDGTTRRDRTGTEGCMHVILLDGLGCGVQGKRKAKAVNSGF